MTAEHDLERALGAWLHEVPPHAGRARATVLARIASTPQHGRRRWWAPRTTARPADAAPRPTRRSPSTLSATRLFAALAIVALGTGALFFAASPGPSPGPTTTPVSPSPDPADDPLTRLTLEQAAPGIQRVLDDGAGHGPLGEQSSVAAGADGSVWIAGASGQAYRLGVPGTRPLGNHDAWPDVTVAPDGTVWAVGRGGTCWPSGSGAQLVSIIAGQTVSPALPDDFLVDGLEVDADGSLIVNGIGGTSSGDCHLGSGHPVVARYEDGAWTMLPALPSGTAVGDGGSLAVTPDGTAWLAIDPYNTGRDGSVGLLRFDGAQWSAVADVDRAEPKSVGPIADGPAGTLWIYGISRDARVEPGEAPSTGDRWLRRYADGEWTEYGVAEGVPFLVGSQVYTPEMEVAPDGTLWIAFTLDLHGPMGGNQGQGGVLDAEQTDGPCPGVLSFDGEAWGRYLSGYCATDVAVGLDGRIWATVADAGEGPQGRAGIYVIDPEVAIADE